MDFVGAQLGDALIRYWLDTDRSRRTIFILDKEKKAARSKLYRGGQS